MNNKTITLAGLVALVILGCESSTLKSIGEFSNASKKLLKAGNKIATDIYATCARSRLIEATPVVTNENNKPEYIDFYDVERRDRYVKEECKNHKQSATDISKAFSVVTGYYSNLGILATGDEKESEKLKKSLEGLSGSLNGFFASLTTLGISSIPNEGQVSAGEKVISLLIKVLQQNSREKNAKLAIVCLNDDIQSYTNGLNRFLDEEKGYLTLLEKEKEVLLSTYETLEVIDPEFQPNESEAISDEEENRLPLYPFLIGASDYNLRPKQEQQYNDYLQRVSDAKNFSKILVSTANTHNKLAELFKEDVIDKEENLDDKCQKFLEVKPKPPKKNEDFEPVERIVNEYIEEVKDELESIETDKTKDNKSPNRSR